MAKAKAKEVPVIVVPQSYEAADALMRELGKVQRDLGKKELRLAGKVAKLTEVIERTAGPLKARIRQIEAELQAYAEANRSKLLEGEEKHHDMPAGRLGWRSNPASVDWKSKFNAEKIIEGVKALAERLAASDGPEDQDNAVLVDTFIRLKEEPNKQAMLANPKLAILVPGVKIGSSGETFYVQPVIAVLSEAAP